MATMNVSLPDALKAVVEDRVASGEYASASDYVRDLVRKDEETKRKWAQFDQMIEDAHKSGVSNKTPEQIIADAREEAIQLGAKP